jgi:6-phosphogluconolactonase
MSNSNPQLVLAGSYGAATAPGIYLLEFDAASGALTQRATFAGIESPSFLALHPNGRWLYSTSETSQANGAPGRVWALHLDRAALAFEAINTQPSGGDWPCHLAIDPTGRWLLVSNYGSGSVGVLPILADGSLGALAHRVQHTGSGPNLQRQEGPHAHSATFTPDGRFAIVADLGLDQLVLYTLDQATGQLGEHSRAQLPPGAGPRHIAFHPSGRLLYVANELGNSVAAYSYQPGGGVLALGQVIDTLPAGAPESYVADIHLAPDGGRLYASNRGHNSLAVYDIGAEGQLVRVAVAPCGGNWPRNFAVAPGGRFVLVANQYSGDLAVLPLDAALPVGPAVAHVAVPTAAFVLFA